ncbi:MAG TPA: thiamine pyrophosphate-dependent enzyme [Bacillota bacterium]|nr:thiamine pyrophosphate-dependent enzyme [Bacillota bacterium]
MNYEAVDRGADGLILVPVKPEWALLKDEIVDDGKRPAFVKNIADPVNQIRGYELPVSAFVGYEDGHIPLGTSAYEKRGVAEEVSTWISENCIQCNQCSFACPHACIRPILATPAEAAAAPEGTVWKDAVGQGLQGLKYKIQVSILDCTGCGVCVTTCPAKTKALTLRPIAEQIEKKEHVKADYLYNVVTNKVHLVGKTNLKNTQFAKPLFEFSGACGGCGETPYIKMVTQLFGDRLVIANATGCSSIYGASFPASPYTKNAEGRGPAWANSLFEDNAEFGFGMRIANETLRDRIQNLIVEGLPKIENEEAKTLLNDWVENRANGEKTLELSRKLIPLLEKDPSDPAKAILELKAYLVKQSNWIFGGDGWAYDIGYGGLDHVIANNEDVNILVLDTEVYSNTGGQSSKAARPGSIAKFTAAGKVQKRKDLAAIAMSYGHVYVATIAHGASGAQVLKALTEAEAYPGPSIVIAYSPCINHGLHNGMGTSHLQAKLAVECGYWPTFRFDPRLVEQGKNPFQMDSKEPDWNKYRDFLMSETRYNQLAQINPDKAEELLQANLDDSKRRYAMYKRYLAMDYSKPE